MSETFFANKSTIFPKIIVTCLSLIYCASLLNYIFLIFNAVPLKSLIIICAQWSMQFPHLSFKIAFTLSYALVCPH